MVSRGRRVLFCFPPTHNSPSSLPPHQDMNGIIHNCTHGNDPDTRLTETEMTLRVFQYLDKIFSIVRPRRLLFMAVDGVAPRAKMNQQRSRRFKSAKERLEAEAEAERKGDPPPGGGFDSNCITPGTPFMARLGAHLRFFVRRKMKADPAWRAPRIVLSGHDVPGEGGERRDWAKNDVRAPHTPNKNTPLTHPLSLAPTQANTKSWKPSASPASPRATSPASATACTAWTPT